MTTAELIEEAKSAKNHDQPEIWFMDNHVELIRHLEELRRVIAGETPPAPGEEWK